MGTENFRAKRSRLTVGCQALSRSLNNLITPLLLCLLGFSNPGQTESLTILSQNANRLFDNVDDGYKEQVLSTTQFNEKTNRLSRLIGNQYDLPHVIALQEVENHNVLDTLIVELNRLHGIRYNPVLVPGNDTSGINVAFLIHPDWRITQRSQLLGEVTLSSDALPLYTRPPLLVRLCREGECLSLINIHLRSMRGLRSKKRSDWVASKRLQQASMLARWIDKFQRDNPTEILLLVGDFNALTPADEHVDVRGVLLGQADNPDTRLQEEDLIKRDLLDLTQNIPVKYRYSYLYRGKKQQLDYLLTNRAKTLSVETIGFSRIDYKLSDHAALYARLRW